MLVKCKVLDYLHASRETMVEEWEKKRLKFNHFDYVAI